MILSRRAFPRVLGPALLAGAAVSACSGGTPPPPDTFVAASLGPGTMASSQVCDFGNRSSVITIGTGADEAGILATPLVESNGEGSVNVQCSVAQSGSGFKIDLQASKASVGSVQIAGQVDSSGGSSISFTLTDNSGATWAPPSSSPDSCTIAYTYNGNAVSTKGGPIANGRIWGHVSCPVLVEAGGQKIIVAGTEMSPECDGETDFLFENCAE